MSGTLTIRNLTTQPLSLILVEHFEILPPPTTYPSSKRERLASNFTSLWNDVASNKSFSSKQQETYPKLDDNARSVTTDDVDIRVEPFKTQRTQIQTGSNSDDGKKYVLRLSIQSGGGVYCLDVPAPTSESQVLKPIDPDNDAREYTAIYNPVTSFLALFDSTDLSQWMKAMPDYLPVSALSLPGTHNSPACYNALPSVRCQAVSITKQLENGIRFFDVRIQVDEPDKVSSDALSLVHGTFPISLTGLKRARELFEDVYAFLEKSPSETVVLCLKREGRGNGTDGQLSDRLKDYYIPNTKRWYTNPGIPKLGQVRGRIVLMRRFKLSDRLQKEHHGRGWGVNATNWADNTPDHHGGDVHVQDFYEVTDTENIDKKVKIVCDHFERASNAPTNTSNGPLFVNFLSAANFWKPGCWPDKIAAKLNPAVTAFLCEKHDVGPDGDGCTGVVVCDFVGDLGDWDLVRAIIGMNSRLLLPSEDQHVRDLPHDATTALSATDANGDDV